MAGLTTITRRAHGGVGREDGPTSGQKKQLAQQVQRAQRNRDQRTWMQIGRMMAGLGVDSVEKMRKLANLVINEPQWDTWLEAIGIVLAADEDGVLTAVEKTPADPPKGEENVSPNVSKA